MRPVVISAQPLMTVLARKNNAMAGALGFTLNYHQKTKHRLKAYARGPETLDWDDQPDPFMAFVSCPQAMLPLAKLDALSNAIYFREKNQSEQNPEPLDIVSVSFFLRYSLGLAAWKQFGPDQWSLRINPSSGNLHPTETYLLFPSSRPELTAGLHHYNVKQHSLEQRWKTTGPANTNHFYLAFTSVSWREAWKYGERAFRYCQLDLGHAIATVCAVAVALGWRVYWQSDLALPKLAEILGLQRESDGRAFLEEAECLLRVDAGADNEDVIPFTDLLPVDAQWFGRPTDIGGRSPYQWRLVDQVFAETERQSLKLANPWVELTQDQTGVSAPLGYQPDRRRFSDVVLQRRSAQRFKKQSITLQQFTTILAGLYEYQQNLMLFENPSYMGMCFILLVHRVDGVIPGLYFLPGTLNAGDTLRKTLQAQLSDQLHWEEQNHLPYIGGNEVWQMQKGDFSQLNATLCCHQRIASDCAFSVGFLSPFSTLLQRAGPFAYRAMHWQAGFLAQQVYLNATYMNLQATGIGCFFDDEWHQWLGIVGNDFQFLYHMAVGSAVVDERMTSLSGYYHLDQR